MPPKQSPQIRKEGFVWGGRPLVVKAFAVLSLVGLLFDFVRDHSGWHVALGLGITALIVALIWERSRTGWIVLVSVSAMVLVGALSNLSNHDVETLVFTTLNIAILASPPMVKWIWKHHPKE